MSRKPTTITSILEFVYAFQFVPRMALRSLGFNYSHTGAAVEQCIKRNYFKEQRVCGENMLRIQKEGIKYLEKLKGESYPEWLTKGLEKRAQGTNDRKRQIKFAWVVAMIYHMVPDIATQYIEAEREYRQELLRNSSSLNINADSFPFEQAQISNMSTREKIQSKIQERSIQSDNQNWHYLTREMKMADVNGLKKMSAARATGVLHLQTRNYVMYNSVSNRIKLYSDYEQKYIDYASDLLHDRDPSLLVFAKSYKVALATIHAPNKDRSRYLTGNYLYKQQFYVPLVSGGAKQLDVYSIPNFREAAREAILDPADIERAKNLIYDGQTESKELIFLGFECELMEIQKIYDIFTTVRADSEIHIYCFSWQSKFYHDLFGDRSEITIVDDKKFLEFLSDRQIQYQQSDGLAAA
jgi:hypothetical protein